MSEETKLLQHRSLADLEGLTIRRVIESPQGRNRRDVEFVFIFEDNSWCAICAESDGDDGASACVENFTHDITSICKPSELLDAGLINIAQMELLKRKEDEQFLADQRTRVDNLRKQIERIEKANPNLVSADSVPPAK